MRKDSYSKSQILEILKSATVNITPADMATLAKIFSYQLFVEYSRLIKVLKILEKGRK